MLTLGTVQQHPAIWLENEALRIGVLPEKGADIFEFCQRATAVQFLMETPWGLKPSPGAAAADFLDNYEGGWQVLFPNANDACEYRGRKIPFHGEAALLPWEWQVVRDDAVETAILLSVECRLTPFKLERTIRLRSGESRLMVEETIINVGSEPFEFVWGQHLTLGGDFLEEGCLFECPARRITTPPTLFEPKTARLEAGQDERWPLALGRKGERIDLQHIPGPQAHTHDDAMLGGLESGWYSVMNPRLRLRFRLEWEVEVFPWLMYWQPYGGADLPPLTGIYGAGLEPWSAPMPLAEAAKAGLARTLKPGERLDTTIIASVDNLG